MTSIPQLDFAATILSAEETYAYDVSKFQHFNFSFIANQTCTINFKWYIKRADTPDILDTHTYSLDTYGIFLNSQIKAKYLSIEVQPLFTPCSVKFSSLFHEAPLGLAILENTGAGAKIYKKSEHQVRSVISSDSTVFISELIDAIDLRVAAAVYPITSGSFINVVDNITFISINNLSPNITTIITAVNNDVQVGGSYPNYTIDIGSSGTIGSISITNGTGDNLAGNYAVRIGHQAGQTTQQRDATSVGYLSGQINQGERACAIGLFSGNDNQGEDAIAMGNRSGITRQGARSVALGCDAAMTDQSLNAVSIGYASSSLNQGFGAISIGSFASATGNQPARSIAFGADCATPGAQGRLAFGAQMETAILVSASSREALTRLIPLEWNGTLYRVPILSSTATDIQQTALTAGTNITITGSYPNYTIAASGGGSSVKTISHLFEIDLQDPLGGTSWTYYTNQDTIRVIVCRFPVACTLKYATLRPDYLNGWSNQSTDLTGGNIEITWGSFPNDTNPTSTGSFSPYSGAPHISIPSTDINSATKNFRCLTYNLNVAIAANDLVSIRVVNNITDTGARAVFYDPLLSIIYEYT